MCCCVISRVPFRTCFIESSSVSSLLPSDGRALDNNKRQSHISCKFLVRCLPRGLHYLVAGNLLIRCKICKTWSAFTTVWADISGQSPYKGSLAIWFRRLFHAIFSFGAFRIQICSLCMLFIQESLSSLLPSGIMCLRLHFMNVKPFTCLLSDLCFISDSCVLKRTSCCLVKNVI